MSHRQSYENSRRYSSSNSRRRSRYDEDHSRRRDRDGRSPKRHSHSSLQNFVTSRKIVEVDNSNIPTCRVSGCQWIGFDDELLSHCIRNHKVLESDEEDVIRVQHWMPSDIYKSILLKFKSLLVWLYIEAADYQADIVVQYASADRIGKQFRYNVGLGTIEHERRANFCKIAPNSILSAKDLFAKYKASLEYKTLAMMGHLPLTLTITPDDFDKSTKPLQETRYFFGCEDFKREAEKALREKFTCPVCLNFINIDARFCVRGHAVCKLCFPKLKECPLCRGEYGVDFKNEEAEVLLRFLHFPGPDENEY